MEALLEDEPEQKDRYYRLDKCPDGAEIRTCKSVLEVIFCKLEGKPPVLQELLYDGCLVGCRSLVHRLVIIAYSALAFFDQLPQ